MATTTIDNMTILDWAQRAYWILKSAKDEGCTLNYAKLAERMSYPYAVWHSEFGSILELVTLTDPNVAACAVNKDTGRPSQPFYDAVDRHGLTRRLDPSLAAS
jgi:hypothetical protein